MSKEQLSTEELNKSIDSLIDDLFADETENVSKGSPIDIAHDAQTTADAAANQAPKAQKDEARGAGRPQQISDVPQTDMDGRRESQYDASITENENKEDEPEETDQSPSMDQTQEKMRVADKPTPPPVRPFVKSESGDEQISEEDWKAFQDFKKSQAEAKQAEELKKAEEMKKAEEQKQADLIKSAVAEALAPIQKENNELKKSLNEQSELVKAMANQPQRPKSITGIEQLEKSQDPDMNTDEPESFTKSDLKDAAFELAKSKQISEDVAYEIDMTGTTMDRAARARIEKYLQTGK